MQNRAYSMLEVKAFDDATRTFSGIATTPTVDRVGDIIDPLGVKFTNPLPFLWQHNHDQPVGQVNFDKPTPNGIKFTAKLVHPDADPLVCGGIDHQSSGNPGLQADDVHHSEIVGAGRDTRAAILHDRPDQHVGMLDLRLVDIG